MNAAGFLFEAIRRNIVGVFYVGILLSLIDNTQSVPPAYCLPPLNTSDCKGPPTAVAYYYKPGSRCEVGIWRGCPTENMFLDEIICVHTCLAKGFFRVDSRENYIIEITTPTISVTTPEDEGIELTEWESQLDQISEGEADDLNDILNDMLDPEAGPKRIQLKFTLGTIGTTPVTDDNYPTAEVGTSSIEHTERTKTTAEETTIADTIITTSTMKDTTVEETAIEDTTALEPTVSTTTEYITTTTTSTTVAPTTIDQGDADEVVLTL